MTGTGVTAAQANGTEDERRAQLVRYQAETKRIQLQLFKEAKEVAQTMMDMASSGPDARYRLFLKDASKNLTIQYAHYITGCGTRGQQPITIGGVAAEMGHRRLERNQSQAIGKALARLYRERHGDSPPKHMQYVDGAPRMVSSYFEKDRDLMEHAIEMVMT